MFLKRTKRKPRFTTRLREVREQAGLSVQELADHCQVAPETVTLIEEAKYEPSIVLAEHLATKFETTVEALFTINLLPDIKRAQRDERLEFAEYRYAYWVLMFIVFGSLVAANVFLNFHLSDEVGFTLCAVWAIGSLLIIAVDTAIPGYWRYTWSLNRRNTPPKKRILSAVGQGLFFATFMTIYSSLTDTRPQTTMWQVRSFLFLGGFFGGFMYLVNYYRGRKKPRS